MTNHRGLTDVQFYCIPQNDRVILRIVHNIDKSNRKLISTQKIAWDKLEKTNYIRFDSLLERGFKIIDSRFCERCKFKAQMFVSEQNAKHSLSMRFPQTVNNTLFHELNPTSR